MGTSADTTTDGAGARPAAAGAVGLPLDPPGPFRLSIPAIQGADHVSPLVASGLPAFLAGQVPLGGTAVVASGVVTAVGTDGFFLQDPAGDGDLATSDAVFVAAAAPSVLPGQTVQVAGTVRETLPGGTEGGALPRTEIAAESVEVVEPAPAVFPTATEIGPGGRLPPTGAFEPDGFARFDPATGALDFLESLEGMLVVLPEAVVVGPTDAGGAVHLVVPGSPGRLSDAGALTVAAGDFNPERFRLAAEPGLAAGPGVPALPLGARISGLEAVLAADAEGYRLIPLRPFEVALPEPAAPPVATLAGDAATLTLAVATLADGGAPGQADAAARQILGSLRGPDILALAPPATRADGAEPASAALGALLAALDRADDGAENGSSPYALLTGSGPAAGAPAILYRADRVAPEAAAPTAVFADAAGAPPALSAGFVFAGEAVTVVAARFTPKGDGPPAFGARQPVEALQEDPSVNPGLAARRAEAAAVNAHVDALLAAGRETVLVLGDLGEHGFVSPVAAILPGPEPVLTDLAAALPEGEHHDRIVEGNAMALAHVLASDRPAATARFEIVHLASGLPAAADAPFAHDPLLAAVALGAEAAPVTLGTHGPDTLAGGAGPDAIGALGGDDTILASPGDDWLNGGAGRDTVAYALPRGSVSLAQEAGGILTLVAPDGTDRLAGVERVAFADGVLLLDPDDPDAAFVLRVYLAAFGRAPDEAGLLFHAGRLADGAGRVPLAAAFAGSAEFAGRYGADASDAEFVGALYRNTLGREAEAGGLGFWSAALGAGLSRAEATAAFADSAELIARAAPLTEDGLFLPAPDQDIADYLL